MLLRGSSGILKCCLMVCECFKIVCEEVIRGYWNCFLLVVCVVDGVSKEVVVLSGF